MTLKIEELGYRRIKKELIKQKAEFNEILEILVKHNAKNEADMNSFNDKYDELIELVGDLIENS